MDAHLIPNIGNISSELKAHPAWVLWKYIDGRKLPFDPKSPTNTASSTDPASWGSFEQALGAYQAGGFAGCGVVLDGSDLVGVDLDGCVVNGQPSEKALALIEQLDAPYVELSPSGRGLRMFGYGEPLVAGINGELEGLKAEFYSSKRYLTVTGHVIKSEPLRKLKNFADIAQKFKMSTRKGSDLTENSGVASADKHAACIELVLSGRVYHDALRDLAASYITYGMTPAVTEANLYALMDGVRADKGERWQARRKQIPALVQSAFEKFATSGFTHATGKAGRYKPLGGAGLRALPNTKWRMKGVLPETGLAAVFGPPSSGKTFLCMAIAAALASGGEWCGHKINASDVLYVALEGEGGIKQRAAAWERHHECELPGRLQFVLDDFKVVKAQDIADLASEIAQGGVVFIDTLNRAAPECDENSSADMGQIIEGAKELQRRIGGLVVLVHHTGKDASKGLRGHSSLIAALDAAIEVTRTGEDREWRIAKSKDGRDGCSNAFKLESLVLGLDCDGDEITSCVVVPCASGALPKPLTPAQEEALQALSEAACHAPDCLVSRDEWRKAFFKRRTGHLKNTNSVAFTRALDALTATGVVAKVGDRYMGSGFDRAA